MGRVCFAGYQDYQDEMLAKLEKAMHAIFVRFDTDQDGLLSKAECLRLARATGGIPDSATDEQVNKQMDQMLELFGTTAGINVEGLNASYAALGKMQHPEDELEAMAAMIRTVFRDIKVLGITEEEADRGFKRK